MERAKYNSRYRSSNVIWADRDVAQNATLATGSACRDTFSCTTCYCKNPNTKRLFIRTTSLGATQKFGIGATRYDKQPEKRQAGTLNMMSCSRQPVISPKIQESWRRRKPVKPSRRGNKRYTSKPVRKKAKQLDLPNSIKKEVKEKWMN